MALARRGRGLGARDTLALTLSHKGRGDPLASIRAWFEFATLVSLSGDAPLSLKLEFVSWHRVQERALQTRSQLWDFHGVYHFGGEAED